MSDATIYLPSKDGEPAWEAAYFFPLQGHWTEETFLQFHSNRMAELVAGRLEILPMPTWLHQLIVDFLLTWIKTYLSDKDVGGVALMAPLPTRLFPGTIREPDILYVRPEHIPDNIRGYPDKLDMAVEVVSEGAEARKRDYEDKRIDYAKAGIREYWIIDPQEQLVTVLVLDGEQYGEHGVFATGQTATSRLLPGLSILVDEIWVLAKTQQS
jgi:Uma2 family endonuclease